VLHDAAHMGMLEEPKKTGDGILAFADFCFYETKYTRVL
jgi:hypothetical protein